MGEYADYEIERMMDEGYSPFSGKQPKGRRNKVPADRYYQGNQKKGAKKGKAVPFMVEYPSKNTPSDQLPDYPEKLVDTSFLNKLKPQPQPPEPSVWDVNNDDAPF